MRREKKWKTCLFVKIIFQLLPETDNERSEMEEDVCFSQAWRGVEVECGEGGVIEILTAVLSWNFAFFISLTLNSSHACRRDKKAGVDYC